MSSNKSEIKRQVAEYAVNHLVRSGMIIGLGYGSTAIHAVNRIAYLFHTGKIQDIACVSTSKEYEELAKELALPLTTLAENPVVDLTIDGADEAERTLNLIKGGGGMLLREKIVATASLQTAIVIDDRKLSSQLGTNWPVPVEVVPFGWSVTAAYIENLGAEVKMRLTEEQKPYITDQGNYILDSQFGPIFDAQDLARTLKKCVGIVEHGLFINIATDLFIASEQGIEHLRKPIS